MSWFFIFLLLVFSFTSSVSEALQAKKTPSAVVVGTVYCDTCFLAGFSKSSHFIPGATVAVECKGKNNAGLNFHQEVKTDKHGVFKVKLPFSVSKHVKRIRRCSVKLLSSSEPYCAVASTATRSSLHLKSRKQGEPIFSAGFFTFKPQSQPNLCNQKPSIQNSRDLPDKKISLTPLATNPGDPTLSPPLQGPATPNLPPVNNQFYLPPLPLLPKLPPLPQLPPLPPLPGLPYFPPMPRNTFQTKPVRSSMNTDSLSATARIPDEFPINLPPNPLQNSPLIPNPFQTPPAPLVPELPPISGLTPSSPPSLPLPFPPLPPRSSGITPASP